MNTVSWVGLGLVAALGGAGVAIFGKIGLEGIDSTLATTLRSVVMTCVLLLVAASTGQLRTLAAGTAGVDGRAWTFVILAGLSGAVSWIAYFGALKVGAATQVAAIDRLSLAFVILFATVFLGERYGFRGWFGVALVVVGVVLVASDSRANDEPQVSPAVSQDPQD